jgi:hypothetical protein
MKKIRSVLRDRSQGMSYRKLTAKHGVPASTIHGWVKEFGTEGSAVRRSKPHGKHRPKVLADLTIEVLVAAAKVTRYDTGRLMELLSPFIVELQRIGGKPKSLEVCKRTVQRELNAAGVGSGYQYRYLYDAGTVVIHGMPIRWQQIDTEEPRKGHMLCIVERNSGFAYFHAFTQIKDKSLYEHIDEFQKRHQAPINQLIISRELQRTVNPVEPVATIIRKSADELWGEICDARRPLAIGIDILVDDPTPRRAAALQLPGLYVDIDMLNEQLHRLADRFNGEKRKQLEGKRISPEYAKLTPNERLWEILRSYPAKSYYMEKTFRKKVRFSLAHAAHTVNGQVGRVSGDLGDGS